MRRGSMGASLMCLNMSTESSRTSSHFLHFLGIEYLTAEMSPSFTNLRHFLITVLLCSTFRLTLLIFAPMVVLIGANFWWLVEAMWPAMSMVIGNLVFRGSLGSLWRASQSRQ